VKNTDSTLSHTVISDNTIINRRSGAMKKLAIISSYNESCGNASYTEVLRREFSYYCDVEVLPLPQFLLRSQHQNVIKNGDRYIDKLAERLKEFDYVNIQFEAGLFGVTKKSILKRVSKLINASTNLIVTMHRIDLPRRVVDKDVLKLLLRFRFNEAFHTCRHHDFLNLYRDLIEILKKKDCKSKGSVAVIVHTRREKFNIEEIFGFHNVYDFPITFLSKTQRAYQRSADDRKAFIKRYGFKPDDKVIGLFGFISEYKGFDTVLKALIHLPSNYKLAFFGRQHPMSIVDNLSVDQYIKRLIDMIEEKSIDLKTRYKIYSDMFMAESNKPKAINNRFMTESDKKGLKLEEFELGGLYLPPSYYQSMSCEKILVRENLEKASKQLLDSSFDERVFFKGELSDDDFIAALYGCDFVILPYVETNQSGSGVASLTVETRARALFSNTHAFTQLQIYYPDCFETFDIGNYLELAQKIMNYSHDYTSNIKKCMEYYNIENNVRLHLKIFEKAEEEKAESND